MADRFPLSHIADDDVPQTPKLQLISAEQPWDDTVAPPTRPARLTGSTRLMLCGFLFVFGFLAGVAAQKHHDAGYLSPAAVSRAMVNANIGQQSAPPPTSQVPHTDVPSPQ